MTGIGRALGQSRIPSSGTKRRVWLYRAMFGEIQLPPHWPVYVSHAEAAAFARWAGKALPTEAQWHRAAYGTPRELKDFTHGVSEGPDARRGNFDLCNWDPKPVNAHPGGQSAFGVEGMLGNGWEWTSTAFAPFRGFVPFPFYRGYSADFFDGKHFVMKGGSARTAASMLRPTFRNWFQAHYQYVYAGFRCVNIRPRSEVMLVHAIPTDAAYEFATEVRAGLTRSDQKELPSKYLYDDVGSALFEVISHLPEYGLTRADERVLRRHAKEIVDRVPGPVAVAELGSGSGKKTRWLLEAFCRRQRTSYYPVEISHSALVMCERELSDIDAISIVGFEREYLDGLLEVAAYRKPGQHLCVLFLGSTIGNFDRAAAVKFLSEVRCILQPGDSLLLGTDLGKIQLTIAVCV